MDYIISTFIVGSDTRDFDTEGITPPPFFLLSVYILILNKISLGTGHYLSPGGGAENVNLE